MCRRNIDTFTESKIVQLNLQDNTYFLFNTERNTSYFEMNMKANSDIVKQRSTEWFEMRKKVKVTGSTLHTALGLENLTTN